MVEINSEAAKELGLSLNQAYLFGYLFALPTHGQDLVIGTETFYYANRALVEVALPLLSRNDKPNTIYRMYHTLQKMGLIEYRNVRGSDLVKVTNTAKKKWSKHIQVIET